MFLYMQKEDFKEYLGLICAVGVWAKSEVRSKEITSIKHTSGHASEPV